MHKHSRKNQLQYRPLDSEVPLFNVRFVWLAAFMCLFLAPSGNAQNAKHPLDALSTEEYWTVYDVIQASGYIDEDTHYASVLLHEPAKDVVLAWKSGQPVLREADATLMRKGKTIEARVDIAARKLEFWKEVPGVQAPIFVSEILGMSDTIWPTNELKKLWPSVVTQT